MRLSFNGEYFYVTCAFEERRILRETGFRWSGKNRRWYTASARVAGKLRVHADQSAKNELNRIQIIETPWLGPLPVPAGLSLMPFQERAARFALSRNRSYLGLDPGLGKTIIAAVISRELAKLKHVTAYVCPPFLTRTVEDEFIKWKAPYALIVPDSKIYRFEFASQIAKLLDHAREHGRPTLLFVDEAHRFKTENSQRSQALYEWARKFDRVVFLSGTPMPNRPIELYSVLSNAAPETINHVDRFNYGRKYCAGYHNGHGWDFSGASNMGELRERVYGKFMLRMKKAQVLPELPPKTEETIFIGDNPPKLIAALEKQILEDHAGEDLLKEELADEITDSTGKPSVATYRRILGEAKVKDSVAVLKALLDSDEAILVFAYHTKVIEMLAQSLAKFAPIVITGQTPMKDRHELVHAFQTSQIRRLFIGQIQAAGTGFTLTKASRVVFVEYSWVPAENDQAADRAHRIGQKDHVFVQYLVYRNSIDRTVLETVLRKRKVINQLEGN